MKTANCSPISPAPPRWKSAAASCPAATIAFRLHVSSSYRETFDRAVTQVLDRQGWQIVRVKASARPSRSKAEGACARAA